MADLSPVPPRSIGMIDAVLNRILRTRSDHGRAQAYSPTMLDAEMLEAADAAVASRIPLAFVLPFPAPAVAMQLAAAAVVGSIVINRDLDVSVAVATASVTTATTYDRLHLRDERLADFVSRSRVTADGTIRDLRRARAGEGRMYVTGAVDRLTDLLPTLDAVVVDASAATPASMTSLLAAAEHTAVLYVTRSPLDPTLAVLRESGVLVWGWDTHSARQLGAAAEPTRLDIHSTQSIGPLTVPVRALATAADATITISSPTAAGFLATDLDVALSSLWRILGNLLGAYARHGTGAPAAGTGTATRWAWSLFYVAATLPVAAARYDEHIRVNPYLPPARLTDAPTIAREYARAVHGPLLEAWHRVADAYRDVIDAAAAQAKLAPLIAWVSSQSDARIPSTILVRNAAMAAAVTTALTESPDTPDGWNRFVQVGLLHDLDALLATADASDDGPLQHLCLTGALPRSGAGLLAAPPCPRLTILTAGPAEASRVTRSALDARSSLLDIRWETTQLTSALLGVDVRAPYRSYDPASHLTDGEHAAAGAVADETSPWEPFTVDVGALLLDTINAGTDDRDAIPPIRLEDGTAVAAVDALALHLILDRDTASAGAHGDSSGDELVLLLAPNDLITRRRGSRLDRVAGKAMEPDDVLLLVSREARQDLLTTVIEKLSEATTYATLAMLVGFWHERASLVRDSGRTYASILHAMTGTQITTETTIGSWVRADVDGPLDKADISRFANAVGDPVLAAEAERIGWALTTLHRVHRKIGAWLSAQVSGAMLADTDATVDASLDIHVADLLDTVTSWRVIAIETARRRVPVPLLGLLLPPGEAAALPRCPTEQALQDADAPSTSR